MMLWLLSGCLARQAPAYTWAWSPDAPRAELPSAREGKVLAVLAGDGGLPHPWGALTDAPCTSWEDDAVALAIRDELADGGELFWLGDNVYPGQPGEDDGRACEDRGPWASGRAALTRQADAGYRSRTHFIPGNHDYAGGRRARVEAQATLIEQLDADAVAYRDPVQSVDLGPIAVVAYDTQYAMQLDPEGTLAALQDQVKAATDRGKRVALIGHHPLYSVGPHAFHPWRALLTNTDQAHPRYQRWRKRLLPQLELWQAQGQVPITFSGHDHSLQLLQVDQGLHVVSGAGSQLTRVRGAGGPGLKVHHAEATLGYAVLTQDDRGSVAVELVTIRPENGTGCTAIGESGHYRCRVAAMSF